MNLYAGKSMSKRKQIDKDLKERGKPKMFYQTSEIRYRTNILTGVMEPYVHKTNSSPFRRR